jgi:hypothetical protein
LHQVTQAVQIDNVVTLNLQRRKAIAWAVFGLKVIDTGLIPKPDGFGSAVNGPTSRSAQTIENEGCRETRHSLK